MIRLGTVFSGIGAIEHALNRMGIENKIVFACDSGDVDVLSKKIVENFCSIKQELAELTEIIDKIVVDNDDDKLYKEELDLMLSRTIEEYNKISDELFSYPSNSLSGLAIDLLERILIQERIKPTRHKEYMKFLDALKVEHNAGNSLYKGLSVIVNVLNDFKKDNSLDSLEQENAEYTSADNIDWKKVVNILSFAYKSLDQFNGKKFIKALKDVAERTSMLHEKINSFSILKQLSLMDSYKKKKEFVDELYRPKASQNKVKETYMANYAINEDDYHWNISFMDGRQYAGKVDLFVGGSPCQSFSLVGKQRGLEDTRGTLFYEYARLIKEIQPKVFIYENVKAILSNDNGKTWEKMKEVFNSLGYDVYYKIGDKPSVLNAKDYGIPQNRERMFVVGFRKDLVLDCPFEFPKQIPLEKKMKDFLLDNVSGRYYLPEKGVKFVTSEKNITKRYTQIDGDIQLCQKKNQQFNWHGDFVFVEENHDMEKTMEELEKYFLSEKVEKYVLATGTKNFYSKPKTDLDIARPLLTTMHKMHRAGVDNYVHTEGRLRKLTPRECLRLMGFCDSFKIVVSDTAAYQQAGNSIVVDVLIHIVERILTSYPQLCEG